MADEKRIAHLPTEAGSGPEAADKERERLLEPGDRAGDYEVVRHLGGGAMGEVYEGIHRAIGKRVAIKVIKYSLADSEEAAARFVREARAVNQIDHPNVLDVFAFGHLPGGRPYLVMDLLEGRSLGARIRGDGPLGIAAFLEVLESVCLALDAAHERGVIHRDLKPDNVFLGEEESGRRRVYVLDFGIAKVLSDAAAETGKGTLTGEGVWIGTPAYMAPEQWTAEGASARSDVYALGAMAYEMLSGRAPYRADSVPAIMEQHFHAEVPALESGEGRAALPREVGDAIRKAMAKKPEERYPSGGAFFAAIKAACRAVPDRATSDRARVPRAALLLGGALGVGVIALVALLFLGGDLLGGPEEAEAPGATEEPEPSEPEVPPPEDEAAHDEVTLRLEVTPAGSRIEVNGELRGTSTPAAVLTGRAGEALEVRLSHPGCLTQTLPLEANGGQEVKRIALEPVEDFAGTWSLPGGELRHLAREDQEVRVDAVDPRTGAREPHQRLRFIEAPDGAVVFETSTTVTEAEAPEGEGCRRELRTQYRYWPADKRLELRTERDQVVVEDGACRTLARGFRPWEILERHWSGEAPRGGTVDLPKKNADTRAKNALRNKKGIPRRTQKKAPSPFKEPANAPAAEQKRAPPAQQAAPSKKPAPSGD